MDKALARHIVGAAFRSSGQLEELIPLLKAHCNEEEGKEFGLAIAHAISHIHREITDKVFSSHPHLREEVENSIGTYGRIL